MLELPGTRGLKRLILTNFLNKRNKYNEGSGKGSPNPVDNLDESRLVEKMEPGGNNTLVEHNLAENDDSGDQKPHGGEPDLAASEGGRGFPTKEQNLAIQEPLITGVKIQTPC